MASSTPSRTVNHRKLESLQPSLSHQSTYIEALKESLNRATKNHYKVTMLSATVRPLSTTILVEKTLFMICKNDLL